MAMLTREQVLAAYQRTQESREKLTGGGGGTSTPFVKMSGGYNRLRFFAPQEPDVPFVFVRLHRWSQGESFRTALDLRTVFEDDFLRDSICNGLLSDQDSKLYAAFGDPFTKLGYAMTEGEKVDRDNNKHAWLLPSSSVFYSAAKQGSNGWELGILERGPKFHDDLMALVLGREVQDEATGTVRKIAPVAPDLFSEENGADVEVVGNGQAGLQRRYSAPSIASDSAGAFDVPEGSRPNLKTALRNRYMSWLDKYDVIERKFGAQFLTDHGLGKSDLQRATG